jgi:hypothetical protein
MYGFPFEEAAFELADEHPVTVELFRLVLSLESSLLDQSPHRIGHFLPPP